MLYRSPLH
jgi:hypothetical protein